VLKIPFPRPSRRNLQVRIPGVLWENFLTLKISEGPLSILKKKIDDNQLMPDDHQMQVISDLQKLYEQVKTYEPKAATSGLSKWFSFGQKEAPEKEIQGLYIYGSVGGGKTMLVREIIFVMSAD
jgi:predicted ATPase